MAIMSEEKKPAAADKKSPAPTKAPPERPKGPEPTRYGDWETNGRCSDF
jgi:hypothetical protein